MSRGLTKEGINALDTAPERYVERGDLPGLVALVTRGADVHVAAIGHKAFGDAEATELVTDFWAAAYAAIDA